MKVKVIFPGVAIVLAAVGVLALGPGQLERGRAADLAAKSGRASAYRDGNSWVSFERRGAGERGLERVLLTVGGRSFHASVGAHAVVRLRSSQHAPAEALRRHRLRLVRALSPALGLYLAQGERGEDGLDVAARLVGADDLAAVPDLYTARRRQQLRIPPDDPRYGGQWYLQRIDIEAAWRVASGAAGVTIAVVDDGCDMTHPDLEAAWVGGRDVLDGDDDPSPEPEVPGNEHGTACAGIAAARGDNGIGIAGTCPGCSLACIRLLGGAGRLIPLSADIAAFDYAYEIGAAVVSNSWGFAEPMPVSAPLAAAVERVATGARAGRGALVVFAAGNENRALMDDEITGLPHVVNVGAVNNFDESAPFGNTGRSVDLSAPTGSLTTDIAGPDGADRGDYTNLFGGTSAACPVVAGVAGLMFSYAPQASASEVGELLARTARRAPYATPGGDGHDLIYGYGIVDPLAALRALNPAGTDAPNGGDASALDAGRPLDPAGGAVDAAGAASDAGLPQPADAALAQPADVLTPEADDHDGCAATVRPRPLGPALLLLAFAAGLNRRRRRRGARTRPQIALRSLTRFGPLEKRRTGPL